MIEKSVRFLHTRGYSDESIIFLARVAGGVLEGGELLGMVATMMGAAGMAIGNDSGAAGMAVGGMVGVAIGGMAAAIGISVWKEVELETEELTKLELTNIQTKKMLNLAMMAKTEERAYTQGAAAGVLAGQIPYDIGKHVGQYLDRKDGAHLAQVNKNGALFAERERANAMRQGKHDNSILL